MNILTLSGLELRKAVAMKKGYYTSILTGEIPPLRALFNGGGEMVSPTWVSTYDEELLWEDAPAYESSISDSFPLVWELRDMGWDTTINCTHNAYGDKVLFVYVVNDDRPTDFIEVHSDSSTDPSDAIAKAYLLVRKEMGL